MEITVKNNTVISAGLEPEGKSLILRSLTSRVTDDAVIFRRSTVRVRSERFLDGNRILVDTPGIRVVDDAETIILALERIFSADSVVLGARCTHVVPEIELLHTFALRSTGGCDDGM